MQVLIDEHGHPVDMKIEEMSRQLVQKYINPNDHVLEFGARYGSVSIFISKLLTTGKHLVSVEPDPNVQSCLEYNKQANGADFNTVFGVCSNRKQYLVHHPCVWEQKTYIDPTFAKDRKVVEIKNYSVEELEATYGLKFNALVADCEGFLIEFFNENKEFIQNLDTIIYEEDCTRSHPINNHWVDYTEFENFLINNNFKLVEDLVDNIQLHNKVYIKMK